MQYIAIEFYTMLMEKTDEELEAMNFQTRSLSRYRRYQKSIEFRIKDI